MPREIAGCHSLWSESIINKSQESETQSNTHSWPWLSLSTKIAYVVFLSADDRVFTKRWLKLSSGLGVGLFDFSGSGWVA